MNCDPIARWYRVLEYLVFGRALEARRLEYLEQTANARSVLMLGDGDGRFLAEFATRNPMAHVDSVESSSRMLALAEGRIEKLKIDSGRVRFWAGDARTIELPAQYDLIVTHFFLDCFRVDELQRLVARISERCCPGARWLVSEFHLPDAGSWRAAAKALISVMYLFFQMATGLKVNRLPEYTPILAGNGFRIGRHCSTAGGLLVSELWERTS
jgi:SAM-dependent methyltransferase